MQSPSTLSSKGYRIWRAGVEAVRPHSLLADVVRVTPEEIEVAGRSFSRSAIRKLVVVGGGKAGAEMAEAFEEQLPEDLLSKLVGWLNVPEDCTKELQKIHLHPGRPAGVNRPCSAGVEGTRKILSLVESLTEHDLCVVLLSGGGSALLTLPPPGIEVEQKQDLIDQLESAGADIVELNTVRKKLSGVKGGRLAAALNRCPSIGLIISDVVGDPLDIIASGPTVDDQASAKDAVEVLRKRCGKNAPQWALKYLEAQLLSPPLVIPETLSNHIIGSNQRALLACRQEAEELGFRVHSLGSSNTEAATVHAELLVELMESIRSKSQPCSAPACILSGGEPSLTLVPSEQRGRGGRNQHLALHALSQLLSHKDLGEFSLLSGGTDGEDGPTDAAGGLIDTEVLGRARNSKSDIENYLARNDSYSYLESVSGLLKTGPTNTNVMDIRVALCA